MMFWKNVSQGLCCFIFLMSHNLFKHFLRLDITTISKFLLLYVTLRWKLLNVNVVGIAAFLLRGENDVYHWTALWHAGQAWRHPTGQQHAQTCHSHERVSSYLILKLPVRGVKHVTSLLHLRFFLMKINIFSNVTVICLIWMANPWPLLIHWWFMNWAVALLYIFILMLRKKDL